MGPNQSHTRKVEFVANIPLRKFFLVQKLRKSFKMVFVTLEKCLGQNCSSFLKKHFCMVYTPKVIQLFWNVLNTLKITHNIWTTITHANPFNTCFALGLNSIAKLYTVYNIPYITNTVSHAKIQFVFIIKFNTESILVTTSDFLYSKFIVRRCRINKTKLFWGQEEPNKIALISIMLLKLKLENKNTRETHFRWGSNKYAYH